MSRFRKAPASTALSNLTFLQRNSVLLTTYMIFGPTCLQDVPKLSSPSVFQHLRFALIRTIPILRSGPSTFWELNAVSCTRSKTHAEAWCQAGVRTFGRRCKGVGGSDKPPEASGSQLRGTGWANAPWENAGPLEPGTHLAAPLAGERGGARRSENSPVWILGLFHAFSSIKSRTRHMIIKKKISVPPPQTTAVVALCSTSGPHPHPGQVPTAPGSTLSTYR